jgi:para-aminobenzoate synthetase component I
MVFRLDDIALFKEQCLKWAATFDVCCYMDANHHTSSYSKFDGIIAAGVNAEVMAQAGTAFETLRTFRQQHSGLITGFLSYDLKNELEHLESNNAENLYFPNLYFFVPQHLILLQGNQAEILSADATDVWQAINEQVINAPEPATGVNLQSRFTRDEYLETFHQIQQHISRGDLYVTNFCQEFFADNANVKPVDVFRELNQVSLTPFACFFKHYQHYILCASPERFLAKRGDKLISQPIKGTAKRGVTVAEDEDIKQALRRNPKEQQENVMVVDMVRNDLTKSARAGSVQASELFGIYSFEQVHQMISTVTCELRDDLSAVDAIRNTFPMGSMTGAPKVSAMRLMEQYERSRRGMYSGAVGYFSPDGDFDFNVVIRSILYNAGNRYLSFQVGSAITFDAVAEQEYEECLLKAKAMMQVLGKK